MPKTLKNTGKKDKKEIIAVCKKGEDEELGIARTVTKPEVQAAVTIQEIGKAFGELDVGALTSTLAEQTAAVQENDLGRGEAMLVAQTHTLDAIFHAMIQRAARNLGHYPDTVERYMKLALRAQAQSRSTWEAVSAIKNPPMMGYVNQANIANGPQQVNNSVSTTEPAPRAGKTKSMKNKLLDSNDG